MLTSGFPEKEANEIMNHLKVRERLKINLVPNVKRKCQEKKKILRDTLLGDKRTNPLRVSSMPKGVSIILKPIFNTH